MRGRRRSEASDTTSSKFRDASGRWHAKVTVGRNPDGKPARKHITRKTKLELDRAVKELERKRDSGQDVWADTDPTLKQWLDHWLDNVLPLAVRWKTLSPYNSLMNRPNVNRPEFPGGR